jgi:hypothetical protein
MEEIDLYCNSFATASRNLGASTGGFQLSPGPPMGVLAFPQLPEAANQFEAAEIATGMDGGLRWRKASKIAAATVAGPIAGQ